MEEDDQPSDPTHQFDLVIERSSVGPDSMSGGGTDWRLQGTADGQWIVRVNRLAPTFREALVSAISDVQSSGLVVRHVEPDDLVTQADIASRLGRTSESIRLLSLGRRGKGDFPEPVARATLRGSLWSWSEVAVWAKRPAEEVERARLIALANAQLHPTHGSAQEVESLAKDIQEASVPTPRQEDPADSWPSHLDAASGEAADATGPDVMESTAGRRKYS